MDSILWPVMWCISWIFYGVHKILTLVGFSSGPSFAWPLSIVGLVLVIRILLLPLYNKQMRSMQKMQLIQPEMRKIQARYKGRKDAVSRQMMMEEIQALHRKHGTSQFASCLPMLVQIPIFFALFDVLRSFTSLAEGTLTYAPTIRGIGPITQMDAKDILGSELFGAKLSSTFISALNARQTSTAIVVGLLVLIMVVSQFLSMKYITLKNMASPDGSDQQAQMMRVMQKMMLYFIPFMLLLSGMAFPLGLVIYWFTNNFWTMGQQTYMVYQHPNPGTPAWEKKQARIREARIAKGLPAEEPKSVEEIFEELPRGQRVQPVSKKRAKKQGIQLGEQNADDIAKANAERALNAREQAEIIAAKQQVTEENLRKGLKLSDADLEAAISKRVSENREAAAKKAAALAKKTKNKKRK